MAASGRGKRCQQSARKKGSRNISKEIHNIYAFDHVDAAIGRVVQWFQGWLRFSENDWIPIPWCRSLRSTFSNVAERMDVNDQGAMIILSIWAHQHVMCMTLDEVSSYECARRDTRMNVAIPIWLFYELTEEGEDKDVVPCFFLDRIWTERTKQTERTSQQNKTDTLLFCEKKIKVDALHLQLEVFVKRHVDETREY